MTIKNILFVNFLFLAKLSVAQNNTELPINWYLMDKQWDGYYGISL